MGIQDRDYMRRSVLDGPEPTARTRVVAAPPGPHSFHKLISWLAICILLALAAGLYSNPAGLYRGCSAASLTLDANKDGVFNYDDVPVAVAQIIKYPTASLLHLPSAKPAPEFFKVKKGNCNSIGAIALTASTWYILLVIFLSLQHLLRLAITRRTKGVEVFSIFSKNLLIFSVLASVLSHVSPAEVLGKTEQGKVFKKSNQSSQVKIKGKNQVRNEVLRLANAARAEGRKCGANYLHPAGPLELREELNFASLDHAKDMAINGYFSHKSLSGFTPSERARARGYRWTAVGENIGKGYKSAEHVVRGWLGSPGHCTNIMNPMFTHMGVDYEQGKSGEKYWVQMFGSTQF